MTSGTVLVAQAQTLLRGTAHAAAITRELPGIESTLGNAEARLPFDAYVQLWERCAASSRDPDFGLHVAERSLDASAFGVVGFAARSAPTLGDAFETAIRHSPVLNETTRTRLCVEGSIATIRDGPFDPTQPWPRHKAEYVMAAYVLLSRAWAGLDETPLGVAFQHAPPSTLETHRTIFGTDLRFGAAHNELRFPSRWLDLPLRQHEPRLHELLERRAHDLGSSLARSEDLLERLRSVIIDRLPRGGSPPIECAAAQLGVGHRTLPRRLRERGTSSRGVIDELRQQRCRTLLTDPELTVAHVASLLGFSETKAFRRAVRRWTGLCPREFRARMQ